MAYDKELPFDGWVNTLPDLLRSDPLWKSAYYRLSMYIYNLMWLDAQKINKDFRGREIVHQLGELGETQGWYFRPRHILGSEILNRRIEVIQKNNCIDYYSH